MSITSWWRTRARQENPSSPASPLEVHAHAPAAGRPLIHWLLEGLLIVISVALGFWLAQLGESRENQALAERVLEGLQAELEYNLAITEPQITHHRKWIVALERSDATSRGKTGFEVFLATRPDLPADIRTNFPIVRRAAWDAALSTGALRLIDYDLAAGLSEIYGMQEYLGTVVGRIPFSSSSFFEPGSLAASTQQVRSAMQEAAWAEETLVGLYRQQLAVIRDAASGR